MGEPLNRDELEAIASDARDLARVTKAQYDAFVEVGFLPDQALHLTTEWMLSHFGQTRDDD